MNRSPVLSTLCAVLALGLGAMTLSGAALAVAGDKGARDQARAGAKASYEAEHRLCDGKPGNAKDVCVAQAKANRVRAEATAEAAYKGTEQARFAAAKDIAEADYKLAKEKCDDQTGPAKGACKKESRAEMIKAKADAKATRKINKAENEAAKEKRSADYRVAAGKCDALSGDAKSACLLQAEATYGQAAYRGSERTHFGAVKDIADADYKLAKERCNDQTGPVKSVCEKEARAEMIKTQADAKATRRIGKAQGDATKEKRAADYKVAAGKCDALSGDAKSACLVKAEATYGQ